MTALPTGKIFPFVRLINPWLLVLVFPVTGSHQQVNTGTVTVNSREAAQESRSPPPGGPRAHAVELFWHPRPVAWGTLDAALGQGVRCRLPLHPWVPSSPAAPHSGRLQGAPCPARRARAGGEEAPGGAGPSPGAWWVSGSFWPCCSSHLQNCRLPGRAGRGAGTRRSRGTAPLHRTGCVQRGRGGPGSRWCAELLPRICPAVAMATLPVLTSPGKKSLQTFNSAAHLGAF